MDKHRIRGLFGLVVGTSVIGLWLMLIMTKQVPELDSQFKEITLHIIAEVLMAITLIVGGWLQWQRHPKGTMVFLIGNGMLLYSVINAAGYYLQLGQLPMVIMFGVIGMGSLSLLPYKECS